MNKLIVTPNEITEDLAYLCGMLLGDGHLSHRKDKNDYSVKCVGNPADEVELYDDVIAPLFQEIFNVDVKPKIRDSGTTYGIEIHSKCIVKFLSERIGIPIGAKSGIIEIPDVFKGNSDIIRSFICGFADADFCFTLKRRYKNIQYYPVIEGGSKSRKIMEQISEYLEGMGFKISRDFDRPVYDDRIKKSVTVHRLNIYGHRQLVLWMNLIGTKNPKNKERFELWRKRNVDNPRARDLIAGVGFEFVDGVPVGKPSPTTSGSLKRPYEPFAVCH